MYSLRSPKTKAVTRLIVLARCLAAILVLAYCAYGQTQVKVTAEPPAVTDAAKPVDVVLRVIKPDNTPDPTFIGQLGSVKVGDATATIKSTDAANSAITITPPQNLAGVQSVQLLDKSGRVLAETHLQYPAQSSGATTTPPIEIRQNSLSQSWWYRVAVIFLFALVVGIFVYTLARVIRFSRSSFRNPLGFPVGSFRAMLAFTLVAFLGFYVFASVLSISDFPPPQSLLGIVATVIGFYFGSRSNEEGSVDPGVAGIVRGIVNTGPGPNPVGGATVMFKPAAGAGGATATSPLYTRVTDVQGHFAPVNAKPGKYTVRAEAAGLTPGEVAITVTEGSDQEIVITLQAAH